MIDSPLIIILAIWEMAIGIGFLSGKARLVMLVMLLQMAAAMSPLILASRKTPKSLAEYLRDQAQNFLGGTDLEFTSDYILRCAGEKDEEAELFADYGMTAVLNGLVGIAERGQFPDESQNDPVGWNYENQQNAVKDEEALKAYFIALFEGTLDE